MGRHHDRGTRGKHCHVHRVLNVVSSRKLVQGTGRLRKDRDNGKNRCNKKIRQSTTRRSTSTMTGYVGSINNLKTNTTMRNSMSGENAAKADVSKSFEPSNESEFESAIRNKEASSEGRQTYYVVEHTPFVIVWFEGAYRIAVGNQIVSDMKFQLIDSAKSYIKKKPWELIFALIAVMQTLKTNEK